MRSEVLGAMYDIEPKAQKLLDNNFVYHAPQPGQTERYAELRDEAKAFAEYLSRQCPVSRELSVAITHLETCVFWANAAIARNE